MGKSGFAIWDTTTGLQVGTTIEYGDLKEFRFRVGSPLVDIVSPHSACVIDTTSGAMTVPPWDVPMKPGDNLVSSFMVSSNGHLIAFGCSDTTALVFSTDKSHTLVASLPHPRPVTGVTFDAGGAKLASVDELGNTRVWDISRSQQIGPQIRTPPQVQSLLVFSGDGGRIASHSDWSSIARVIFTQPRQLLHDASLAEAIAQFASGFRIESRTGVLLEIPADDRHRLWESLRPRLEKAGLDDWILASERTLPLRSDTRCTPSCTLTVREYSDRLALSGEKESILEALEIDPENSLARLARAIIEPDETSANFLGNFALRHLPLDVERCLQATELLIEKNDFQWALRSFDRACAVQPGDPRLKDPKLVRWIRLARWAKGCGDCEGMATQARKKQFQVPDFEDKTRVLRIMRAAFALKKSDNNREKLIVALGDAAFAALFARQSEEAGKRAEEGLQLISEGGFGGSADNQGSKALLYAYQAHARLFAGRLEEALAIYSAHWNDAIADQSFKQRTIEHFVMFEKAGLPDDNIVAIERVLNILPKTD